MTVFMCVLAAISLVSLVVGIRALFFPTDAEIEAYLDRWAD